VKKGASGGGKTKNEWGCPPSSLLPPPPFSPTQFKIEPFKHPVTMDPSYGGAWRGGERQGRRGGGGVKGSTRARRRRGVARRALAAPHFVPSPSLSFSSLLLEKTWRVLEAAIHEINNHNASGLSFEELYR